MSERDTKTKILDAAERLFAEKGVAATSLREITAAAGANLAAVNYHFGTKEALAQAVYARRLEPANRDRIAMLDDAEARAAGSAVTLEEILDAFVTPFLRRFAGTPFTALMGRIHVEPGDFTRRLVASQMSEIVRRFGPALHRALPELPAEELFWRVHFSVGALAHTLAGGRILEVLSQGKCDPRDVEAVRRRMVAFLCAGFRAEVSNNL